MTPRTREQRLEAILHAYLQAVDRGEKPDRQVILDAHPDLRDELQAYFADASRLDALAQSLRTVDASASTASPSLGTVRYVGDYELLEEIARGGMGVVYRARQVSLNRVVALKMILKGEFANEADVRRFRQEAEAAANLDHPNIVPIYEVGEHEGQQYFSMKLIERGESAAKNPAAYAARLVKVARAVHHAHQRGILHRDLKPSNILLDANGEPHVADFGLAKHLASGGRESPDSPTVTGAIVGTPAYMAPEQARAEKSLTVAVDVYSLGAILYEWLTGRPPFRGDDALSTLLKVINDDPASVRSLNSSIDRDLETICHKCLEKDPVKRYASAEALADDLERWQRGEPILARPLGNVERAWRWCRRNPVMAGLSGALVTSVLLGLLLVTRFWIQAEQLRLEAERQRDQSTWRLARTHISRATEQVERGDSLGALPWLVSAWPLEQKDPVRDRIHRLRLDLHERHAPRLLWERSVSEQPGLVGGRVWADFSPDGKQIISIGHHDSGWIEVCDVATSQPVRERILLPFRPSHATLDGTGRRLAVSQETLGSRLAVWDPVTGRQLSPAGEKGDLPGLVANFASDGKHVLLSDVTEVRMCAYAGTVRLWDWTTAKPIWPGVEIGLCGSGERQDCISPDGKAVLIAGGNGQAQLRDQATGKPLGDPWSHDGVWAAFRPDGKVVATVKQGCLHLTEVATGKAHTAVPLPTDSVRWGWFTHGGRYVLTLGPFGELGLYDAETAERVTGATPPQGRIAGPVAASPDGQLVAFAEDGGVHFRTIEGQPAPVTIPTLNVRQIRFHPDGRRLLTLDGLGRLRLWDMTTQGQRRRPSPGWTQHYRRSSAGMLALATRHQVTLYDADLTHRATVAYSLTNSGAGLFGFSADGSTLTVAHEKTIRCLEAATGKPHGKPRTLSGTIRAFRSSPDARFVAIATDNGVVVWEPTSDAAPVTLPEAEDVTFLAIHGKRVLVGPALQWYDHRTGLKDGPPLEIPTNTAGEREARSLDDGRHLLVVEGQKLRLWDLAKNEPLGPAFTPPVGLMDLVVSPDRKRFATLTLNEEARVWDLSTGEPITPPLRHQRAEQMGAEPSPDTQLLTYFSPASALRVAFSPDGHLLVSSSRLDTRLWDAQTGDLVGPRLEGASPILAPDGRLLTLWRGALLETELMPTSHSPETWQRLAATLSGFEIDTTGGYVLVPRNRQPDVPLESIAENATAFHRDRIARLSVDTEFTDPECPTNGRESYLLESALWHLDRIEKPTADDHAFRGSVHRVLGRWQQSDAAWTQAIQAGCGDADALAARAFARARQDRWQEAAGDLAQARRLPPERFPPYRDSDRRLSVSLVHRQALAHLLAGDTEAYPRLCREELTQARQGSASEEQRFRTAWICSLGTQTLDDREDVIAWAQNYLKRTKYMEYADAQLVLAGLLLQRGRAKEALAHLEDNPQSGDLLKFESRTHLRRAQAYLQLGQKEAARKALQTAREANGWSGDSWWLTAERMLLARQVEKTLEKP